MAMATIMEGDDSYDDFIIIEIDSRAVRRWRLLLSYLLVILASRAQWGSLGNWLKDYKQLK